ncbi:17456_t:CDS:2 [Rhizophagus irregularis]|nr:17456_t:CDS:2 [Rhizophagus irregularis]
MTSITSITSKNKKKKQSNNLPSKIASEPTLTHKETIQTIIDLSDDFTEPTKDICIYDFLDAETTQEKSQKIEVSMSPIKGTKRKKQFWKENLEEWKRGKVKVYQKIISENVLPGRTLDQFRNKIWFSQMEEILSQSKAINPDYVTDSASDSPPISDDENSDNKKKL